jgi:hypothetical protein
MAQVDNGASKVYVDSVVGVLEATHNADVAGVTNRVAVLESRTNAVDSPYTVTPIICLTNSAVLGSNVWIWTGAAINGTSAVRFAVAPNYVAATGAGTTAYIPIPQ